MPKHIKYTAEQLAFVKANCVMARAQLTEIFNNRFGTALSVINIASLCKRNKWNTGRTGCFKPGIKTWNTGTKGLSKPNSGSFKKGDQPFNLKPIGYERICSKDGYVLVKVAEPNKFKHKHRVIWEAAHGPVPKGHVIAFINMDKTDVRLENLMMLSRAELVRYNQSFKPLAKPENNQSCLLMAKIKHKRYAIAV